MKFPNLLLISWVCESFNFEFLLLHGSHVVCTQVSKGSGDKHYANACQRLDRTDKQTKGKTDKQTHKQTKIY